MYTDFLVSNPEVRHGSVRPPEKRTGLYRHTNDAREAYRAQHAPPDSDVTRRVTVTTYAVTNLPVYNPA